jgi:DNA-binding response OmpR family regulator
MSKKILVVEDRLFLMRLIQHHLEKAGYELVRARNSREAVDAVGTQSPEVVLVDDASAQSELGSTLSQINEENGGHCVRIIHMTDVPPPRGGLHSAHADVVLTRPFSPTQLVAEINRLCCA